MYLKQYNLNYKKLKLAMILKNMTSKYMNRFKI